MSKMNKEVLNKLRGKIGLKAECVLETDEERMLVWNMIERETPKKPELSDHDHEEYFSKEVVCSACGETIGSYSYGRAWCDGSYKYLIEHHKYCNKCGTKVDWSDVEKEDN